MAPDFQSGVRNCPRRFESCLPLTDLQNSIIVYYIKDKVEIMRQSLQHISIISMRKQLKRWCKDLYADDVLKNDTEG